MADILTPEPTEKHPRTFEVEVWREGHAYIAVIGNGYLVEIGPTEYAATIGAIDALLSGLAGIASTKEHLEAITALRDRVAQRLQDLERGAIDC